MNGKPLRFRWKDRFTSNGVSANEAGRIIIELQENDSGLVTPEQIVRHACHPENPLHRLFEWDDTKAAEQFRLEQARNILRSLVYDVEIIPGKVEEIRYTVNVMQNGQNGYASIETALANDDLSRQVIDEASRYVQIAIKRLSQYRQMAKIVGTLEKAINLLHENAEIV